MRNPIRGIKTNGKGAEVQGGVAEVPFAWMPARKEVINMRKTTLIIGFMGIVAGLAMAFLAGLGTNTETASADNGPHVATGADATHDKCASCHRIHTGQNEYLLKEAGTIEGFCYSCHGTGGAGSDLAVQEGTFYGGTAPGAPYGGKTASDTVGLRGGGFDEARINTTDPSQSVSGAPTPTPTVVVSIGVLATKQPVNSRHAIDGTAGTMWGKGPPGTVGAGTSNTLECTSCHDPHGNGNYRILRTLPTGSELAPAAAGYPIPDTYPKGPTNYTTGNYFTMNHDADLNGTADPLPAALPAGATPAPGQSIMVDTSRWCSQCHTRYLAVRNPTVPTPAPGGIDADASRVNSGDVIFTFRHTSAGWSRSSSTGIASFNNRACITCHATHGSNASMPGKPAAGTNYSATVPWPDGSTVNPANDLQRASLLKVDNRGICRRCHNVGSVP